MPKDKNKNIVKELTEKVKKAKSIILTEYKGMSANAMNDFRSKTRQVGAEVSVSKNTLLNIALKNAGYEINKNLKGETATVFAYEDSINPIKIIAEFAKKMELPKIKSGFFEGKLFSGEDLTALSSLPSKKELYASMLSSFNAPLNKFVGTLGNTNRKFIYALSAITKKKEQS